MGSFVAGTSLINPVDLVRFAVVYLALVVAPGYALAALARPRSNRMERLTLAIPCAYSLVAASGLATALLHIPYGLPAYVALALPITLAGAWVTWQRPGGPRAERELWWAVPLGVVVMQVGILAVIYAGYVMPVTHDAVAHVMWTSAIARSQVFPIALQSSHLGSADGAFYPPVFHVVTALILDVAPMAAQRAVFYSVLAAVVMLPVALFSYVRTVTGRPRLGALAALVALAFEPLPLFMVLGGLYPFTVSQLFTPALAVALCDGPGRGDRRSTALAALLGVGLFYTHPTEFVTVALLTLPLLPGLRLGALTAGSWARLCGYGAIVAAFWSLCAAPALLAVQRTMVAAGAEIKDKHNFAGPPQVHLQALLDGYVSSVYSRNLSYLLLAAVVVGVAWCLAHGRWRSLILVQAILFAIFLDTNSYNLLHRFYVLSFPWATWERLPVTQYWCVLPLAAIGVDAAVRGARRVLRARAPLYAGLVAAPLVVIGLLMPLDVTAGRIATYTDTRTVITPSDLGAITWLREHAPSGSVVVNDSNVDPRVAFDAPIDAGLWMPVLGGPQPLFWQQETGPGALGDRNYLLLHIADTPLPARARGFIHDHHVRYVFYGSTIRQVSARRHLSLPRLLADPSLRLVYSSAACRRGSAGGYMNCPTTGTYVFAIASASSTPASGA